MPVYEFAFLELFSYVGFSPEQPGGDFGFTCFIEAADEARALEWGYAVLGDYRRARFKFSDAPEDGRPFRKGWIARSFAGWTEAAVPPGVPRCAVGEFPTYDEAVVWKKAVAVGTRDAGGPPREPPDVTPPPGRSA